MLAVVRVKFATPPKTKKNDPPPPGLCLKGRGGGGIGAVPERLQSGRRGCESGWGVGGYWRLEMRLGLVLGYGNAFGVESGQWGGGRGVSPPPPPQAIPSPPRGGYYGDKTRRIHPLAS